MGRRVMDYNDLDKSGPLTQGGVFIALVQLINTRRGVAVVVHAAENDVNKSDTLDSVGGCSPQHFQLMKRIMNGLLPPWPLSVYRLCTSGVRPPPEMDVIRDVLKRLANQADV